MNTLNLVKTFGAVILMLLAVTLVNPAPLEVQGPLATNAPPSSFIIQGDDLRTVAGLVEARGGRITHEFAIINAVAAELTAEQQRVLERQDPLLKLFPNAGVSTAGFMWTELNVSPGEHAKLLIRGIGLRITHTLKTLWTKVSM